MFPSHLLSASRLAFNGFVVLLVLTFLGDQAGAPLVAHEAALQAGQGKAATSFAEDQGALKLRRAQRPQRFGDQPPAPPVEDQASSNKDKDAAPLDHFAASQRKTDQAGLQRSQTQTAGSSVQDEAAAEFFERFAPFQRFREQAAALSRQDQAAASSARDQAAAKCVDPIEAVNRYIFTAATDRPDLVLSADLACTEQMRREKKGFVVDGWALVGGENMDMAGGSAALAQLLSEQKKELKRKDGELAQLAAFHLLLASVFYGNHEWAHVTEPYLRVGFKGGLKNWIKAALKHFDDMAKGKGKPKDLVTLRDDFHSLTVETGPLAENPFVREGLELWLRTTITPDFLRRLGSHGSAWRRWRAALARITRK